MKRRSNEENCEGWLSTRNKKKVCPSVSSKHPIAYKHATYSFVSTPKLTQNMAPLNQHQTSILKFVQKGEQKFGVGKNLDVEKKIRPDIETINPDFYGTSLKNMANIKTNADEFKQVVSCERPTNNVNFPNECSSEYGGNLEKLKRKHFDHSEKKFSKENFFSEKDSISVETLKEMNTENISHDLVRNSILFDTTNLSVLNTFSAAEVKNFKGKNNRILNDKFELSENSLPHNHSPKNASTPTKNIRLANQNPPNVTGLKTSIDCYGTLIDCQKHMLADCQKETHTSKDDVGIFVPNSDKSPNRKTLIERQQASQTTDGKMLPKNKFDYKSDNYEVKECVFDLNPQEGNISCSTFGENNLFEEKSVGDSLTDFSKFPSTFPINSRSSKEILPNKVFNDSESHESTDFAPISDACKVQDEKLNNSNHIQSLNCDEKQWTHHFNPTGYDFETASTFDRNTCQFDEYFESSECQQDNSDETFTLELGNPDFTLRTQRNVNESLDLIPETEDFTFNSDSI